MLEGTVLPFSTRTMLFNDQTEKTDGDRTKQREGWSAGKDEGPSPRTVADALRRRVGLCRIRGHAQRPNLNVRQYQTRYRLSNTHAWHKLRF